MFKTTHEFDIYVPLIMRDLMSILHADKETACAIIGNGARESGGFRFVKQQGGGDGVGWWQWSGARNRLFREFCVSRHMNFEVPAASMLYLVQELRTTYKGAFGDTVRAIGLTAKTETFEKKFEAAGVPAMGDRVEWAIAASQLSPADHGFITG